MKSQRRSQRKLGEGGGGGGAVMVRKPKEKVEQRGPNLWKGEIK